jgi:hypothetical protein
MKSHKIAEELLSKAVEKIRLAKQQVKEESVKIDDFAGNAAYEFIDIIKPEPIKIPQSQIRFIEQQTEEQLEEASRIPTKTGNIVFVNLGWRGKNYSIRIFFPSIKKPSRSDVRDQLQKIYPGSRLWHYQVSDYEPGEPLLQAGGD